MLKGDAVNGDAPKGEACCDCCTAANGLVMPETEPPNGLDCPPGRFASTCTGATKGDAVTDAPKGDACDETAAVPPNGLVEVLELANGFCTAFGCIATFELLETANGDAPAAANGVTVGCALPKGDACARAAEPNRLAADEANGLGVLEANGLAALEVDDVAVPVANGDCANADCW